MIEVSVTLVSAINGKRTKLALMHIANDGKETKTALDRFGTYDAIAYRGRGEQLDKLSPIKTGTVQHWPREAYHIWNLVRGCLTALGYTKGAR